MELTVKDLQIFYNCSKPTALHRKQEIISALELPKNKKRILLLHLAKYEGLTVDECKQVIKLYKVAKTG
ncbi:hypothetical protein KEM09_12080 [Carboxylicivirga mesophila]|uniref:Uncharacterized protein n=1 Tax=Carboxylicivirga mesophila TaxID=1166478 RepID=A0ABS5KCT3_9BACT|nr:hypothetical protein [Carboxylicivirga mesophila]MBS2212148.1 hypothetical protein [Carboxylicivirga mesophila]